MNKKFLNLAVGKIFAGCFFCVSVQILKKFSILNIEIKSIQKEIRKKDWK